MSLILFLLFQWMTPASANFLPIQKTPPLRIAVLDTGLDTQHFYLSSSVWTNPGETGLDSRGNNRAHNQIDDDLDGLIDDVNGWNFVDDNGDVSDDIGHGTHVAGLIRSRAIEDLDFRKPESSTKVEFIPLKYYDEKTSAFAAGQNFLRALRTAIKWNVDLIQISGGGFTSNATEFSLLQLARQKGIAVITASGNKKAKEPDRSFFPGAYLLSNIFSVAATNLTGQLLSTSNLNKGTNFYECGDHILSTLPKNKFGTLTGSSQAAAVFTGKLLKSRNFLLKL